MTITEAEAVGIVRVAVASIIAPSAFAEVRRRTAGGGSTGTLKYVGRERNRQRALTKADDILRLLGLAP